MVNYKTLNKLLNIPTFYDIDNVNEHSSFMIGYDVYIPHPTKPGNIIKIRINDIIRVSFNSEVKFFIKDHTWFKEYLVPTEYAFHSRLDALNKSNSYFRKFIEL